MCKADPGTHTGVAIYSRETEKIIDARTLDFGRTLALLDATYPPDCCDVIVEDASLNKPTFRKDPNQRKQDRMSRNVGMVQKESKLIIGELKRRGYNVVRVRPTSAKWDAKMTERITGWNRRCSEHARDAIKLCFGVKVVREELAV